ncbi:MAG: UpxY family transcription antiterminator [Bacteroidales bacterium]|nr:UpxY family transcription antiterminator [Bacteroidales bacterium]
MSSTTKYWYVAVTYRKERLIKNELDKINVQNFVPFRQVVKERKGKKVKISELVIPGYVFIYTDNKTSRELTQKLGLGMRYLKEPHSYTPVIIPEKQMQDFITLLSLPEDQAQLVPCDLKKGDPVRIKQGTFAGIEGELIRLHGHKRVLVRLVNIAAVVTAFIPAVFLERIEK